MGIVHFLNVNEGDCTWIEHPSNNNTVIDISNGQKLGRIVESVSMYGNYNQKNHPVNPIEYFKNHGMKKIFRFILTHPDMDHMDGIKQLFETFEVLNFWDTKNTKVMNDNTDWGRYSEEDWNYYQEIRSSTSSPKVLHLYAGDTGKYYNQTEEGKSGADGLYILAPSVELVKQANKTKMYNDCSYVILYKTGHNKKVIFSGDSGKKTWDYILENYKEEIKNIDILIAPHHGRKTGGNDKYLDVLNPKLTLFGNAKSEYLDYSSWNNRQLKFITNNQANCIIIDTNAQDRMDVYVTNEKFAKKYNISSTYCSNYEAWYIMSI